MENTGDNQQWLTATPAPKAVPHIAYAESNLPTDATGSGSVAGLPVPRRRRAFADAMRSSSPSGY